MRVFISSVIKGMEGFREAVTQAIVALGHEPVDAEDFNASPDSPRVSCLEELRESEAMVLILGKRYGAKQTSGLSATHEEYKAAREAQKPVLVMVQQNVDREPLQHEFVQEVQDWATGHYTGTFDTREKLLLETVAALRQLETRGITQKSVHDHFREHLMDYENWHYDGYGKVVYLQDPDYTIDISDASPEYGAGNYWWGNLIEKPKMQWYSLRCKGEKVHKILVMYYYNECLTVPFPSIKTLVDPRDTQREKIKVDCFCEIFYYDKESLGYSLLYHIRNLEARAAVATLSPPIESQIKPPIIRLPFLFFNGDEEFDAFVAKVLGDFPKFVTLKREKELTLEKSEWDMKRFWAERWFSEWVCEKYLREIS